MRSLTHWKPRYVRDRVFEFAYQKLNPSAPWLSRQANLALSSLLKPSDVGLEFGSGRSTFWIAQRIKMLTSVEHDQEWFKKISSVIAEERLENVEYFFRGISTDLTSDLNLHYVDVVTKFADSSLDLVLVDGRFRGHCALRSFEKMRPGGMLVIDNVNWYLPSNSGSPNSRSLADGPLDSIWTDVYSVIAHWRVLWTTSGIADTAIFFKPYDGEIR